MVTIAMLLDRTEPEQIQDRHCVRQDVVHGIRIGARALDTHILYLSSAGETAVRGCTAAGSSFTYLGTLTEALNWFLEVLERYRCYEQDLIALCHRGCTLTELLERTYPILPYLMILLDGNQWMVSCTPPDEQLERCGNTDLLDLVRFRTSSVERIALFNQLYHDCYLKAGVYRIPHYFTDTGYAFNLRHQDQFAGLLLIEFFQTPREGELDLFGVLGAHIQALLNDPTSGLSLTTEEQSLLAYLRESTPAHEAHLRQELQRDAWQDEDPKQVLFATVPEKKGLAPNPQHALALLSRIFGLKAALYQDGLVLVVNRRMVEGARADEVYERLTQMAYCAGESSVFTDLSELSVMVRRAQIALQRGDRSPGACSRFDDHALPYFLSLLRPEDAHILCHPLLATLQRYDARYGSKLYETLFVYLQNERSAVATERALGLHRNTLSHRIARIEELSGGVLEDPETRLRIVLSYYLNN